MEMRRAGVPIKCPNCDSKFMVFPSVAQIAVEPETKVQNLAFEMRMSTVSLGVRFADTLIEGHRCEAWQ